MSSMNILTRFVIGQEYPDFTFTSIIAQMRGRPSGAHLSEPVTTGQMLSLNNPSVPVVTTMTDLVQEQLQKPMTVINNIEVSIDGQVLTFTITKSEIDFGRGGVSAPSAPVVEEIEVDITPPGP